MTIIIIVNDNDGQRLIVKKRTYSGIIIIARRCHDTTYIVVDKI